MGRKEFSKQFKEDAINLVLKEGYRASEAGKSLGIHEGTIREYKQDGEEAFPDKGNMTPEKEELIKLRKEVANLKMERDILKKAAVFFAKESK